MSALVPRRRNSEKPHFGVIRRLSCGKPAARR